MGNSRQRQRSSPQPKINSRLSKSLLPVISGALLAILIGFWTFEQVTVQPLLATSWDAARDEAYASDKLCLLYFYAPYCYACETVSGRLFRQPALARQLQDAYVTYQIDGIKPGQGKELATKYGVKRFPSMVLTDNEGKLIQHLSPLVSDERLLKELQHTAILRSSPLIEAEQARGHQQRGGNEPFDAFSDELPNKVYGLIVDQRESWIAAMMKADQTQLAWAKNIWVHPRGRSGYDVVIGPFVSRGEAQKTQRFMESWEGKDTKVIKMQSRLISQK